MKNLKRRHTKEFSQKEPLIETSKKDNAELPYGGKVFLARKKKPDSWPIFILQVVAVLGVIVLLVYSHYYYEHVHFHLTNFYAHLGYDSAQHHVGNKYLHGHGVDRHEVKAMEWFQKAAEQGHPHASYNLAIGHLKGIKTNLTNNEVRRLIEHAASNGVKEAKHTLENICNKGGCDHN